MPSRLCIRRKRVGACWYHHRWAGNGTCQNVGLRTSAGDQCQETREYSTNVMHRYPFYAAVAALALTCNIHQVVAQVASPSLRVASPPAPMPMATGTRLDLSLADAVFIGLRDNRTVKSAYIERVAQKYDLFVAQTRFVPSAVLTADYGRTWQGTTQTSSTVTPAATWLLPTGATFGFSWAHSNTRGLGANALTDTSVLSLSQPLLKGAGIDVNMAPIRIAELQEKINRLALKSTVADMITKIIQAYRVLLQVQDQLSLSQEALERSKSLLATNHTLVESGRLAASEIVQTEADLANQQVTFLVAQQQRNSAQIALLQLLAMDLHTNVVASDRLQPMHVTVDLDQATEIALRNRMDYLAQQRALEQDRQALIVAENNRLWDVSVTGGLQYQHTSAAGGTFQVQTPSGTTSTVIVPSQPGLSGSVGVHLRIPLDDFTLEQGEVQARTAVRTAATQLEDLNQAVHAQVRDVVQTVELSWRQVEASHTARELAEKTVSLEREKLKVGRASNFEVLTFDANLRSAESQELSAGISYLNALTILDQQLGTTLDTWQITLND